MTDHTGDQLLTLRDAQKLTGRGRTTIYRLMKNGDFPRPVQLSPNAVRWWKRELEQWLQSRPRTKA